MIPVFRHWLTWKLNISQSIELNKIKKTLWGRWGCRWASPWAPISGQFQKIKFVRCFLLLLFVLYFFWFLIFFQRPFLLHPLQKHAIPLGTFVGQLKSYLFWVIYKKYFAHFANVRWGSLFLCFQLCVECWVFKSAHFWTEIKRQH